MTRGVGVGYRLSGGDGRDDIGSDRHPADLRGTLTDVRDGGERRRRAWVTVVGRCRCGVSGGRVLGRGFLVSSQCPGSDRVVTRFDADVSNIQTGMYWVNAQCLQR